MPIKQQFHWHVQAICRQFRYIRQSGRVYHGLNLKELGYDGSEQYLILRFDDLRK